MKNCVRGQLPCGFQVDYIGMSKPHNNKIPPHFYRADWRRPECDGCGFATKDGGNVPVGNDRLRKRAEVLQDEGYDH